MKLLRNAETSELVCMRPKTETSQKQLYLFHWSWNNFCLAVCAIKGFIHYIFLASFSNIGAGI